MATALTDRKRTLLFINIIITCIASSMLVTALTTALPPIMADFAIPATTGQWLTSGYSLAMAIMIPLTAFWINRVPTKKLYCGAIGIFLIGLLICMFSVNFQTMLLGRIVQAAGTGILTSMAQVITLTIFPTEKKGTAMGWYGLSVGAAPVIAPTLAGLLVDHFNWRAIFIVSFAIMSISFVYSLIVFDNVLDTAKRKFDIFSFILSAFAFGGITLGIGNIGNYSFVSLSVLMSLGVGIITSVFFVIRQLRLGEPFLELRQYRTKTAVRLCTKSTCIFLVILPKISLKYTKYFASILYNLTKNLLAYLWHNFCVVLP